MKGLIKLLIGGILGSSSALAACNTELILPKGTFTYELVTSAGKSTMTTTNAPTATGATVTTMVSGKPVVSKYTCKGDSLDLSLGTAAGKGQSFGWSNYPNPNQFKNGYKWTGKMTGGMVSGNYTSTVVKQEKITVPAGTFTAFKIETLSKVNIQLPAGMQLPPGMTKEQFMKMMGGNTDQSSQSWYVKGVGIVKTTSSTVTMTLIKFTN